MGGPGGGYAVVHHMAAQYQQSPVTPPLAEYLLPPPGNSSPLVRAAPAILLILLVSIFIAASLSKFAGLVGELDTAAQRESQRTAITVVHHRLNPYIPLALSEFVGGVAVVELALGVSLIAARRRKSAVLALSGLAFAVFTLTLVLSRNELAGSGCGCIGAGVLEFPSLTANVIRNGVLVVGCLVLAHVWKASRQSGYKRLWLDTQHPFKGEKS
jgi:hypothetical protein